MPLSIPPRRWCALIALALFLLPAAARAQCRVQWSDNFPSGELSNQSVGNSQVHASAVYDDGRGGGPALFLAGDFIYAGGLLSPYIAKWDGRRWSSPGNATYNGAPTTIYALIVFDDGTGPQLYAGGTFTEIAGVPASRIARWNGVQWSPVGAGFGGYVYTLAIHDDGSGPHLYAGGDFGSSGGTNMNRIARWDGSAWSRVGPFGNDGVGGTVYALVSHNDGSGPALFAGGQFTFPSNYIARFNGVTWTQLSRGGTGTTVYALASVPSGPLAGLYVGGTFTTVGQIPNPVISAAHIATWTTAGWAALGAGANNTVRVIKPDATDPGSILVGGDFGSAGAVANTGYLARWNGSSWLNLQDGIVATNSSCSVYTVAQLPASLGSGLAVAGSFRIAGAYSVVSFALWQNGTWHRPGNAPGVNRFFDPGITNSCTVRALATFDIGDGSGPALYVGGAFSGMGDTIAPNVGRWTGTQWLPVGDVNGLGCAACGDSIYCFASTPSDFSGGPAIYAGGHFPGGATSPRNIARWNGAAWSPLAGGLTNVSGAGAAAYAIAFFDGPEGRELAVGGVFAFADSVPVLNIARWNGTRWAPMGDGFDGRVRALAVYNDSSGGGPQLYAAGDFSRSGKAPLNAIARWDGTQWQPVGAGLTDPQFPGNEPLTVKSLLVHDDGAGPQLYAAGSFNTAGGVPARSFAKWNGALWSAVGPNGQFNTVYPSVMTTFDDGRGNGPVLYSAGSFRTNAFAASSSLLRWDGSQFTQVNPSPADPPGTVFALAVFNDPAATLPSLFVGGGFRSVAGVASHRLAQLIPCTGCPADFNASGTLDSADFFDFLAAFLHDDPDADFDLDGRVTSADFFSFIRAFFQGCP